MCGSCRDGYSLLMGSNKCGQCHNDYMMIAWIALFAVMGVILVVLLIAHNLTVSVGTLNGLLFCANIVKLYEPVFSREGVLPVLSQVISWINSDFGFEICFYNGMDSYAKQWLQFAFPLYLWIIIIIIIQLCRRYGKISRLMGSHAVPVLSTLTFLSYTKLLNDTHTQCVDNRGQRMCGSCSEGYSPLMGSNKCEQCHNDYMMIAWIALFAVMGVLLVILLIALNLTVSVGTLNGLLFCANIVKLYKPVFSREGALPVLSQVISWINLDFGFEICFYNGMDSYAKQWLQFAFPLYLWIIIIIIIQLCKRYGKHAGLFGFALLVSVLFVIPYTLFLLFHPVLEKYICHILNCLEVGVISSLLLMLTVAQ
uniref:Uncharacterized protein n=1 Tax=Amphimedon queenslandica TaxID=400682 RepID=A0A1X7TLR5_AMPQE